jgi:hypothetical protein
MNLSLPQLREYRGGIAAFDNAAAQTLEDVLEQCTYQVTCLGTRVIWPQSVAAEGGGGRAKDGGVAGRKEHGTEHPLVPVAVYRRMMASLIHILYSEVISTVLSFTDIPPKQVAISTPNLNPQL